MLIPAVAMALAIYGMMALDGINLVAEKRWSAESCVPILFVSGTANRSRTLSND